MASYMKGLKFDLDETGITTVFKPYQAKLMELLFEKGKMSSGEADIALKTEGVKISRASVIFFL